MSSIRRFTILNVVFMPVLVFALHGCESPVAPKFPDPVEEGDTTVEEGEGATGRRTLGRLAVPAAHEPGPLFMFHCAETRPCR